MTKVKKSVPMTDSQKKIFADIKKAFKMGGEYRTAAGKMYRSLLDRPTSIKQYKTIRGAWDKLSAKETAAASKTATRQQKEKVASRDLKMSQDKLAKQKSEAVGKTTAARRQAANKKAIEKSNSSRGRGGGGAPMLSIKQIDAKEARLDKLS